MLARLVITLSLLDFGQPNETFLIFTFYGAKSLKETSHTFEMTDKPVSTHSHRHCTMRCYFEHQCLAAFFEGEWNLCRLYSNINGTTTGEEGDFSIVKREFGVSVGPYGISSGSDSFSDKEYFIQHGYITGVRSWTNSLHYLSGIQFRYGSVWGPERGFTGNAQPDEEVSFRSGTFINRISLLSGAILDSVTFYSETDEDLGTHGSNPSPNRQNITRKKLMYIEGEVTTYLSAPTFTKVFFHFHGQ